jgi:hypothetical protein
MVLGALLDEKRKWFVIFFLFYFLSRTKTLIIVFF